MRWFFAILIIIIGSFLMELTIYQYGHVAHILMKMTGIFLFFLAGLIVRKKKQKNKTS